MPVFLGQRDDPCPIGHPIGKDEMMQQTESHSAELARGYTIKRTIVNDYQVQSAFEKQR